MERGKGEKTSLNINNKFRKRRKKEKTECNLLFESYKTRKDKENFN